MKKLKFNISYNLDKDTIVDIFHTSHENIDRIGNEINIQLKKNPSVNGIVEYCIGKYADLDLLLALMLVWNICIMDYHFQKEMDLAFKMMSSGVRMPGEMM